MYSVWVVPEDKVYSELARIVSELAQTNGAAPFEPHLTVIGDMQGSRDDLSNRTQTLASDLATFTITFEKLVVIETCTLISVAGTDGIIDAHRHAVSIFAQGETQLFRPHISLFYGPLSNSTERALPARFSTLPASFTAQYLSLAWTPLGTRPDEWRIVDRFALRSV